MGKRRPLKPLTKVVLDASTLIKMVLPEDNEENIKEALTLFRQFTRRESTILLPSFWSYEVGNILIRKLPIGLFIEKFDFLLSQAIQEYSFNRVENLTIGKFAKLHHVTFYDASYYLLAIFTDSIFITADNKYFMQFKGDKHLLLLGDIKF
ncbi:hypothetical protein A2697_05635 [Candidatus Curtissbacteria bacterium RIFCSPHIGHO2_01_FULL_41_44]|uniref:PIN domain-containing protein n=1 Tax=Candidatus Curtissbacteria bacterium RIFCSPLOWO2_01_FULL_42_50 TaxID=1797730 RepID=A0A1F5H5T7_9BACT|nr:MAG: hypothetical protein A2697_05635 [Candidatus Curtissbacteria bacterium RIFCSPHIGHO2_01_FULL_41_44]OGD99523.1 MAG: hypothetical protein A3B54_03415 [Candidatus Curtissbacteria bacterium RIFCSPLOWO2_01_FULL_42_50]OGE09514.1 MAG: hypothetical protein A3H87_04705 [Candidatus Curtissbacteria bacterium RIFCSPLOWO2_02_FULL_42_37]